jgi:DNA polymerase-3 subunit gamma/tau
MMDAVRERDEQFPDYSRLLDDIARDLQRVAVYQVVGSCDSEDDLSQTEIAELAGLMPIADVQLFYQVAIMGRRDLNLAPDPRSGAEMTLLRMLAFKPAATEATGEGAGPASGGLSDVRHVARSDTAVSQTVKADAAEPARQPAATKSWSNPDWSQLVGDLGLTGAVRLLASNCAYLRREGNTVFLGLDPRSDSMLTKQRKDTIAERLSAHFGESLLVDIALGSAKEETPVQQESRLADERLEEARLALEADPNIQTLKSMFGAELKTDTIEIISGDKG